MPHLLVQDVLALRPQPAKRRLRGRRVQRRQRPAGQRWCAKDHVHVAQHIEDRLAHTVLHSRQGDILPEDP